MSPSRPTTVVIADDQALMRAAFRTILEADGIEIVGEAADGDEAVAIVRRERPDVVLMDVRMPGRDGLGATAELTREGSPARVLVLTTFDLDEYLWGALRAGAAGFLLKNAAPEELVAAVRRVAVGDTVLDPAVTGRVVSRFAPATEVPGPDERAVERLTERERDVLVLLARGRTNAEIAADLGVGEATA
ncbi:MAG TPA: response regulator transcription factor [Acidimicrobiales bacterium]|nr:response regulator transcription factor [Acidimicrobiales bacterium]